tara:strand:- start:21 stop:143 length:123 start_codon:yes stop_codon:yes gene_type:complete
MPLAFVSMQAINQTEKSIGSNKMKPIAEEIMSNNSFIISP